MIATPYRKRLAEGVARKLLKWLVTDQVIRRHGGFFVNRQWRYPGCSRFRWSGFFVR